MSVAMKVSAQNQFEIDEAPIQETHVTEEVVPQLLRFDSLPEHGPVRDERARGVLWQSAALHRGTENSEDAHAAAWSIRPVERGWRNTHGRGNTTTS